MRPNKSNPRWSIVFSELPFNTSPFTHLVIPHSVHACPRFSSIAGIIIGTVNSCYIVSIIVCTVTAGTIIPSNTCRLAPRLNLSQLLIHYFPALILCASSYRIVHYFIQIIPAVRHPVLHSFGPYYHPGMTLHFPTCTPQFFHILLSNASTQHFTRNCHGCCIILK